MGIHKKREGKRLRIYNYRGYGRPLSGFENRGIPLPFFDWDGEHTLSKRSAGKRISRQQCGLYNEILNRHIVSRPAPVRPQYIDTRTIRRFRNALFKEDHSGSTINEILGCLKALINAVDEMHLIRLTCGLSELQ